VGTLTLDEEARQYLVAAILRLGNAAGTAEDSQRKSRIMRRW
jgi:hypothetical protein